MARGGEKMARVSAELGKFNRIELAIRDSLQALGRAEKEIELALAAKRTGREIVELNKLKEGCAAKKKRVQSLWESVWDIAGE